MSNYPMVNEINRLVGDLLAGGGEVFLPGVGSLYTERRGARRISRRSVVPPSRAVSFTSQERGVSLVAEISGAVQCDAAEAQDVYDRWLARTLENGVLTIEGVGVLKLKHFTPDAAFDRRLNPQGREPVRIKPARKFDWALWIGIAAILVALGFGGYEFLKLYDEGPEEIAQTTGIPGPEATAGAATADSPAAIPAAADSGATTGSAASAPGADAAKAAGTTADTASGTNAETRSEPAASGANAGTAASSVGGQGNAPAGQKDIAPAKRPETRSAGTADAPASLVSGRRYVVLGVFSTPENAARAVDAAAEKDPSVRNLPFRDEIHGFAVRIGRYGGMCALRPQLQRPVSGPLDLYRPLMRISELIIRFIDWFYRKPVAAILPRQTFRYIVCGGANVAFSWVCYFLVYNFVLDKEQLDLGFVVISAYVATMLLIFPFTFFTGFWLNRYVTFRHSPLPTGTQLFRYLLSIGGSVVVNYVGLKFFVEFCGLWATPSQMLATFVTMIYSYLAAKYFTFRHAEV